MKDRRYVATIPEYLYKQMEEYREKSRYSLNLQINEGIKMFLKNKNKQNEQKTNPQNPQC